MAGESETQSLPDSSEENLHLTQWRLSSHSIKAVQSLGTGLVSLRTGGGVGTYSHSPKDEELSSFYVRFCGRQTEKVQFCPAKRHQPKKPCIG